MARALNRLAVVAIIAMSASSAGAVEGNADAGKKVFAKCAICHGIGDTKKPIGPNLNDVIGRPAATQPDYLAKKSAGYSKAMVAAGAGGLVWTEVEIADWLANPKKKVPGTKMAFPGLQKEQDIADVIAYLKTFSTH